MEKTKIDTFFTALDLEYFKVKYLHFFSAVKDQSSSFIDWLVS